MKNLDIKWEDAPEWADVRGSIGNELVWAGNGRYEYITGNLRGNIYQNIGIDVTVIENRSEQSIPSKAEWMPVGRCTHIYGGGVATREEEEVTIIGIDNIGNYVFQNDKSTCYYSDPASEFRPLKTAEEKKREAIKEVVINSIDTSKFKVSEMGAIAEFLNQMIDKFDVIPAGDK